MARIERIDIDHTGIQRLRVHPDVTGGVEETARAIADKARDIAPVRTGEFRNSISHIQDTAYSTDPKAPFLEYGTRDTPTFATFRNACRLLNLDMRDLGP